MHFYYVMNVHALQSPMCCMNEFTKDMQNWNLAYLINMQIVAKFSQIRTKDSFIY